MTSTSTNNLTWADFLNVEMRVGTVISSTTFLQTNKPAYKLTIDFGEYGERKTSAQITKLYNPDELIGKQVIAVVNFPPKQIANMMSECLLLGVVGLSDDVTLLIPDKKVANGMRIA